jgi:predicted dehydrogenase
MVCEERGRLAQRDVDKLFHGRREVVLKNRVGVAVVGVGFMGELHTRAYAECDAADLVAVVDPNVELGREVASRYGTRHVRDVSELLDDDHIQAYTVALPDRMHVDTASTILSAGRSVLLEKPMSDTLEGARRISEAAEEGGSRLMVAHLLRFDARYATAAQEVSSGSVGDPVHLVGSRFSGRAIGERMQGSSSVCFYLGVHDVDALQWVSGKRITRVYSRAVSKIMPRAGVQSEDSIFTTCEFEDGTIGSLQFGWSMPSYMPHHFYSRLEVVGTDGVIRVDVSGDNIEINNPSGTYLPDASAWPEVNGRLSGLLPNEVSHFVRSVRDGEDFAISVPEAMRAVAVNDAILRSVRSGKPEDVEEVVVGQRTARL